MELVTSESDLMSLISQMYHDKKREISSIGKIPNTKKIFSFALGYAFSTYGNKFGFTGIGQIKSAFAKWRNDRKKALKASVS